MFLSNNNSQISPFSMYRSKMGRKMESSPGRQVETPRYPVQGGSVATQRSSRAAARPTNGGVDPEAFNRFKTYSYNFVNFNKAETQEAFDKSVATYIALGKKRGIPDSFIKDTVDAAREGFITRHPEFSESPQQQIQQTPVAPSVKRVRRPTQPNQTIQPNSVYTVKQPAQAMQPGAPVQDSPATLAWQDGRVFSPSKSYGSISYKEENGKAYLNGTALAPISTMEISELSPLAESYKQKSYSDFARYNDSLLSSSGTAASGYLDPTSDDYKKAADAFAQREAISFQRLLNKFSDPQLYDMALKSSLSAYRLYNHPDKTLRYRSQALRKPSQLLREFNKLRHAVGDLAEENPEALDYLPENSFLKYKNFAIPSTEDPRNVYMEPVYSRDTSFGTIQQSANTQIAPSNPRVAPANTQRRPVNSNGPVASNSLSQAVAPRQPIAMGTSGMPGLPQPVAPVQPINPQMASMNNGTGLTAPSNMGLGSNQNSMASTTPKGMKSPATTGGAPKVTSTPRLAGGSSSIGGSVKQSYVFPLKKASFQTIPGKLPPYEVHKAMKTMEENGTQLSDYYVNGRLWSDRLEDRQKRREKAKKAKMIKKSELLYALKYALRCKIANCVIR